MTGLAALATVDLEELDRSVPLRDRVDRKHLVAVEVLPRLLDALAESHAALELDGRRWFTYDSVYFDTPALLTARAHIQGRRRRFKCRSRSYVDAGTCAFELKLKGPRGETVKHRLPYDPADHGTVTGEALAFLAEHLDAVPDLLPSVRTTYRRATLAGPRERVTIDTGLSYGTARIRDGWAIVETKSERGAGVADRELRRLGSRPLSLSKYVLGAGLTRMASPPNDTRQIARRYFAHA
jgi:hypothetical protein